MSKIFISICIGWAIGCLIMLIKNEVAFRKRSIIREAIHKYHCHCITNRTDMLVDYFDMENYDKTLYRLSDWGYTRILPADKFEIIKPFIK